MPDSNLVKITLLPNPIPGATYIHPPPSSPPHHTPPGYQTPTTTPPPNSIFYLHLFGGFGRSLPRPIILIIITLTLSLLTALSALGSHRCSSTLLRLRWS